MHKQPQRGFTLIEMLAVTSIVGILAAAAYPSFLGPIYKVRRSDGIGALLQLQMAQEKWRSNHGRYADMAELQAAAGSPMRHYTLAVTEHGADHYTLVATATGSQAGDTACRTLGLTVTGYDTRHTSGPDAHMRNNEADNKRCWGA